MPTAQELPIDSTATAMEMAQEIFGAGATVDDATYFGDDLSSGVYSNGDSVAGEVTPGDTGVILSTGYVADFTNDSGTTNTNTSGSTSTNTDGIDGDSQFNALSGGTSTFDAAILLIEFTPVGDTLTIDFVISSEEYPEYINSQFLDAVGVWVNGAQATVTVGDGTASVGNINGANTPNLYTDNTSDQANTEMDGFTITLTFTAPVLEGQTNFLRIGVADVADSNYDTNLLIAGGSIQSAIVAQDDSVTLSNNDTTILDVLANDSSSGGTLTITHVNGEEIFNPGQVVSLSTGQDIIVNADGTLTVAGDDDDETVYFTYTVQDQSGNSDTALVEVTQVPCFVAGTLIETEAGALPVEVLFPGIGVMTRDHGMQPLRWIGRRDVQAEGTFAPIRFRAGAFGAERDAFVSPQHRILVQHQWAQLLFGEDEVLVKAKDLVDGTHVTRVPEGGHVTYVHLLFDDHQIVTANGMPCESYLPGTTTASQFDSESQDEIIALFPELARGFECYGPAARTILKSPEARTLAQRLVA